MSIKENRLVNFLKELVNNNDYDEYICYLLSYLKAIELRYISKKFDSDKSELLIPYIQKNNFNFNWNPDSFKIYENYVNEMYQKTKIFKY